MRRRKVGKSSDILGSNRHRHDISYSESQVANCKLQIVLHKKGFIHSKVVNLVLYYLFLFGIALEAPKYGSTSSILYYISFLSLSGSFKKNGKRRRRIVIIIYTTASIVCHYKYWRWNDNNNTYVEYVSNEPPHIQLCLFYSKLNTKYAFCCRFKTKRIRNAWCLPHFIHFEWWYYIYFRIWVKCTYLNIHKCVANRMTENRKYNIQLSHNSTFDE